MSTTALKSLRPLLLKGLYVDNLLELATKAREAAPGEPANEVSLSLLSHALWRLGRQWEDQPLDTRWVREVADRLVPAIEAALSGPDTIATLQTLTRALESAMTERVRSSATPGHPAA